MLKKNLTQRLPGLHVGCLSEERPGLKRKTLGKHHTGPGFCSDIDAQHSNRNRLVLLNPHHQGNTPPRVIGVQLIRHLSLVIAPDFIIVSHPFQIPFKRDGIKERSLFPRHIPGSGFCLQFGQQGPGIELLVTGKHDRLNPPCTLRVELFERAGKNVLPSPTQQPDEAENGNAEQIPRTLFISRRCHKYFAESSVARERSVMPSRA